MNRRRFHLRGCPKNGVQREPALDPVCGMKVASDSPFERTFRGVGYRFCSKYCMEKFGQNPEDYMGEDFTFDPVCGMKVSRTSQTMQNMRAMTIISVPNTA